MFKRMKEMLGLGATSTARRRVEPRLKKGVGKSPGPTDIRVRRPETPAEYHGLLTSLVLKAPDRFREVVSGDLYADQAKALRAEFDLLRSEFHFVQRKLKDEHLARICQELIEISLEAYLGGDTRTGAHSLQEFRGLVWPKWKLRVKYGVQAEQRAFGANTLYAGVAISPYPYEGTRRDLSKRQEQLLAVAETWYRKHLDSPQHPAYPAESTNFSWVITQDGVVRRTSAAPKEDQHPTLKPLQRSWGFKRLNELANAGEIQACVLVQIPLGNPGLVLCDLEESGHPRVSARRRFERKPGKTTFAATRYFLEDPAIFPEE